nr:PQQ-binding-like beta-propeller repeat protein [Actinoplanes rishiriensis]
MVWRPATPHPLPATDGPLVGSPLSLGGEVAASRAATDGRRAYLAWVRQDDNSLWVTAADLRTGASAWPAPRALAGSSATLERVVSVPGAVLVVTRSEQARIVYALNPSTGALQWDRSRPAGSSLVFTERALVVTDTDRTQGVDWASGRVAWTVNGDRPVRALGMGVASDEERIDRSGPPATFSDDRVVVVTADGMAQVRDAGTGRLLREVAVGPGDPASMVAQDGRLYARDRTADRDGPQRIRSTDLIGTGGTVEVGTADGHFLRLAACGPARVCSVTQGHAGPPVLTAFDVHTGQRAWLSTTGPRGGDVVSSAHGRIMVQGEGGAGLDFFDASGITVYSAAAGGWLGPDTLVVPNPDGSKALSRWSAVDASLTPLNIPYLDLIGGCTSTTDRLACATGRSFKIFRVR